MGFYHAKCEQCWDAIPCNCFKQKERDAYSTGTAQQTLVSEQKETNKLLREQNELLKENTKSKSKIKTKRIKPRSGRKRTNTIKKS